MNNFSYLNQNLSLWINANHNKYFLIPMNEIIPNGDFLISTILGEEKTVDINAINHLEITETEAKEYLETEIKQGLENVKIPLEEIIKSSFSQKPQIDNNEEFIIDLISKLTNTSPQEIKNNPELAKLGLQNFIRQFQQILNNSPSENCNSSQLEHLQDVLTEYGIDMGDLLTKFPENLQQIRDNQNRYSQETSAKLQEFSQKIDVDNEDFKQVLFSFINTYQRLFMSEEQETEIRNQQQEEQTKIIDKTIKDSLEKYPLPSLKFEDLL